MINTGEINKFEKKNSANKIRRFEVGKYKAPLVIICRLTWLYLQDLMMQALQTERQNRTVYCCCAVMFNQQLFYVLTGMPLAWSLFLMT